MKVQGLWSYTRHQLKLGHLHFCKLELTWLFLFFISNWGHLWCISWVIYNQSLSMSHNLWLKILKKPVPKVHNLSSAFCSEHPAVWWPTSIKSLISFSSQVLFRRGSESFRIIQKILKFQAFGPRISALWNVRTFSAFTSSFERVIFWVWGKIGKSIDFSLLQTFQ